MTKNVTRTGDTHSERREDTKKVLSTGIHYSALIDTNTKLVLNVKITTNV